MNPFLYYYNAERYNTHTGKTRYTGGYGENPLMVKKTPKAI